MSTLNGPICARSMASPQQRTQVTQAESLVGNLSVSVGEIELAVKQVYAMAQVFGCCDWTLSQNGWVCRGTLASRLSFVCSSLWRCGFSLRKLRRR